MAGIWSINPDYEPSIINKDTGEVKFPPNDSNDEKSYTIRYVDEELGIECTKAVVQEGKGCKFTYTPESSISSDGGEITLGTFTDYNDDALREATVQVTEDRDSVVTSIEISVSNHTVIGNIKKNEDSSTKTFKYVIKSGNNSECATATVTQSKGCDCDNLSINKTSLDWVWNDETSKNVTITIDPCVTTFSTSSLNHFTTGLTTISATERKLTVTPNGKNKSEQPYTDNLEISYLNNCKKTISLVQNINTCSCNDIAYTPNASIIPSDATSATLGSFTMKNGCDFRLVDIHVSASDDPHGITNGDASISESSPHDIIIGINPHTQTTENLSFNYHIRYNGKTENCYNGSKTQGAGIICSCENITFYQEEFGDRFFGMSQTDNALLGTLQFNPSCKSAIKFTGDDGLSNFRIEDDGKVYVNIAAFTLEDDENYNGRILSFTISVVGDGECGTYEIYQQAFRGTDNGVDTYVDGTELIYPIFLVGENNSSICSDASVGAYCHHKTTCDCVHCNEGCSIHGGYEGDDSIICDDGAYYVNNGVYEQVYAGWSGVDINWDNSNYGVCHLDASPSQYGYCNMGMVRVSATTEWTPTIRETIDDAHPMTLGEAINKGYIRTASFLLATKNDGTTKKILRKNSETCDICKCSFDPPHAGQDCAKKWKYVVWQLPKGYYACFDENGRPYEYNLWPLSKKCNKDRQAGECRCRTT